MKKEMLINVLQPEEIRIAILEDGVLEELYVERTSHESYVGNIYKGRVVNIEPSIQAAFIDFGVGRNGFLHVSDVEPEYYRHLNGPQGRRDDGRRRGRDDGRGEGPRRDAGRGRGPERGRRAPREEPRPLPDYAAEPYVEPVAEIDAGAAVPLVEPVAEVQAPELPAEAAEAIARVEPVTPPSAVDDPESPPSAEPEVAAEKKPKPRRARGGKPRRGKGRGKEAPEAAAEEVPDKDEGEQPKLMDSSERRTDEHQGSHGPALPRPAADIDDEELSFSMARAPQAAAAPPPPRAPEPYVPPAQKERDEEYVRPDRSVLLPECEPLDEEQEEIAELDKVQAEIVELGDDAPAAADFEEEAGDEFEEYESRGERSRRGERGDQQRPAGRGGPNARNDRGRPRRPPGGRPGMLRPKPLIQDIFKRGQEVLVQVIKEGIGTKGPTLSTYISIAGRYLVLMPGLNRIGVSRKIIDEDSRRRLREILGDLQPPRGLGFIIRTAGQDRNKKELQRDLAYLSRLWEVVARRISKIKSPAEIYQESDMITRTIRDIFTSDIDTIWVDEKNAYEAAKEFLTVVMPRYASRIKFWDSTEPMFHKYGIEQEIVRIQQRHVPLPAGGSIVIDQTEALVAIDVNSGSFRADGNAEETAYQMNLQAAKEIARQLRLRDLGGVIVNDFIDMRDEKHRRNVEYALRDAVHRDRARTKILRISQFGLIEMTRQRIRPSLKRSVYHDCTHCRGTGQVKTIESMSIDVMRMLQLAVHRNHMQRIQVRVHDDVAQYLLNRKRREVAQMEEQGGKPITVLSAGNSVSPEFLEFLCLDTNNNEVKFAPFEEPQRAPRRRGRYDDRRHEER
jgi:ribonuclease E